MLINSKLGTEEKLMQYLKEINEVKEIYLVYGVYDIIIILECDSLDALKEIRSKNINSSDNISSSITMTIR
ncbi:MAG: Lrp/AsnC ligand binding domain-containing protein [Candidatus Parcubacteria bacterium]|nr:Lrp/AsnC ligand binding domain-containing protein [Candidatus Parcubacteria bacterium]